MGKKYIRGFDGLRIWPVEENSVSRYVTGAMTAIGGAQSGSVERKTEEYSIPADDGVWDSGADFISETLEVTVIELPLCLMAKLDGAKYDAQTDTYAWGPGAVPPELALGFRAQKADGSYRMVKYYSGRVNSIKTEYKTKGSNKEGSAYVISMSMNTRAADNQLHAIRDSAGPEDLAWLEEMERIPPEALLPLNVTSAEGSQAGTTALTVLPAPAAGQTAHYLLGASLTLPALGERLGADWQALPEGGEVAATAGELAAVAYVDAQGKVKAAGKCDAVTVKA